MKATRFLFALLVLLQFACEKKRTVFGLEESAIRYETKKFDDPTILAEVGGQRFTKEQILGKSPVIADLEKQERSALGNDGEKANHFVRQNIEQRKYRETAAQLNGVLSRILLNNEAVKRKMSLQDFIRSEVITGKVEISDKEFADYLKKIGFAESQITDDLRARLLAGLTAQKEQRLIEEYLASKILRGPIQVSFAPPRSDLQISEDWKPLMGYSDAPVSVVAFSSITCPDCEKFVTTIQAVMRKYDGHLKLNWIHNFSESDATARMIAEASLCADTQEFGSSLDFIRDFAGAGNSVIENSFFEWAQKNELNEAAFKACVVERKTQSLVEKHLAFARKTGIVANPTLWIDGKTLEGVITPEQARLVIENKINESGSTWLSAFIRKIKNFF